MLIRTSEMQIEQLVKKYLEELKELYDESELRTLTRDGFSSS